jgi:alpha-tubulin suppressor-like RCC1 family protein
MNKILLLFFVIYSTVAFSQFCTQKIIAGAHNTLVYTDDNKIYVWGVNANGELGLGNTTVQSSPVLFSSNASAEWLSLSYGSKHSLGVKADGTLWQWGDLSYQFGTSNNISTIPVQVGTATDWVSVSGGNLHSIALKSDGTIWGWGSNDAYQLDNYVFNFQPQLHAAPFQLNADTDWAYIFAGYFNVFAIKQNGTLWARGSGNYGSLGVGYPGYVVNWTQVGTATDWVKITSENRNCFYGIKSDGALWAWGDGDYSNSNGSLGFSTSVDQLVPLQLGTSLWVKVVNGIHHTFGLKQDGTLWYWGNHVYYAPNNGPLLPNQAVPYQIGTSSDWIDIAGGESYNYALKSDSSIWYWGVSGGTFGDGSGISTPTLVEIVNCPALDSESFNQSQVGLYPNPASSTITWQSDLEFDKIEIYAITGQRILERKTNIDKTIDITTLLDGTYILRFIDVSGNSVNKMFVKAK